MGRRKLLIIGHGRSGKDTMAEMLFREFGMKYESSSYAAARIFLYDKLKEEFGYKSFGECYEDRHNHRARWFDEITAYNTPNKTRLAEEILKDSDCYVGMRNSSEIMECRRKEIFDMIVWVDASKRIPNEGNDSFNICKRDADLIIENNGELHQFMEKVLNFGRMFFGKTEDSEVMIAEYPRPDRELRVALDIDGVLADFGGYFLKWMYEKGHIKNWVTPPKDWNDLRFRKHFHRIKDDYNFTLKIPRIPQNPDLGFDVCAYITARDIPSEITRAWLLMNGFQDAPVYSVGHNGEKTDALRDCGANVYVDDSIRNYEQVEASGLIEHNFLMDRSHNLEYDLGDKDFYRIYHIQELKYRLQLLGLL